MTGPVESKSSYPGRQPGRGPSTATVVSAIFLGLANLVTAFCAYSAVSITPRAAWDHDALLGVTVAALCGEVSAVLTALLTIGPVKARWLGKWWFAAPVVMLVIAWARLSWINHVYPE